MRAYSVGLRKKLVDAIRHGKPKAEVARIFGVGISSVKRYMKVAEETVAGSQEGAQQDEKAR
jgi:transposase